MTSAQSCLKTQTYFPYPMTHFDLIAQLKNFLDADELPSNCDSFLLDQRRRYLSNVPVIQPKTVEKVQQVVHFCHQHNITITPQGGNTGLVGGSHAQDGIIINLSKLNRIRHINLADNAITVEAGCILQNVQQAAAENKRFFPLSLASEGSCQIGGNIACNAGGLNVVRYGTMRDLVLGLEVVLPDGSLISQLVPLHKNTTGYDLKHLFIGSEGTLGIITAATLKLFAPAATTATSWVGLESIDDAVHLLTLLQEQFAERLCSFEIISDFALQISTQYTQLSQPTEAKWHILLELSDSLPRDDLHDLLAEFLFTHGFENSIIAQNEQQRQNFWRLRENISAAQSALGISIKHDIATPIHQVASFIQKCGEDLEKQFAGIQIVVFGHLGDGSLHYNTFLPQSDENVYQQENAINSVVYQHIQNHQGTIAAEHGIGCLKNHWLPAVRSPAEIALMRGIKQQFDPKNLFNPNKLLP